MKVRTSSYGWRVDTGTAAALRLGLIVGVRQSNEATAIRHKRAI